MIPIINNDINVGNVYRGNISNRLMKIVDIKNQDNQTYVVIKNMYPQNNEKEITTTNIETFKRLLLTKEL